LVILLLLTCQVSTSASTPFPFTITIPTPEPTLNPANCSTILCYTCYPSIPVVRVIDGDSFESAQEQRVRLFGVDTPERGQPCFGEATERLRQLAGGSVGVEFGPRQADQYGRLLYYVYIVEGESIGEILAREGLALAWEGDAQHRDLLVAAEEGLGMPGWDVFGQIEQRCLLPNSGHHIRNTLCHDSNCSDPSSHQSWASCSKQ
jgi:endonuclease YncB( thermonuclease family)